MDQALNQPLIEKEKTLPSFKKKDHYIVGIGASAGGLEAINELFDNIPSNTDFSFIIVQHLSPDYKSLMAELLSKHTQMKVTEAEDGMLIKPNCVYVIPNKKFMTLKHSKLRLTDKNNAATPNNAIDVFLYSLAQDKTNCAIAIILSGTGTDGTKGIEAIKKAGGMVIVQDPVTAKFDGMPNSAIASGQADFILPPELMAEEMFNYVRHGALMQSFASQSTQEEEATLEEILNLVKEHTSYDFSSYKRHTISRRILRRMAYNNIVQLDKYLNFLRSNQIEVDLLSKEFLIGVTKFFRDTEAFETIRNRVIPEIIENKLPNDQLKIWVAACSTGEEAYSLAIIILEHLLKIDKDLDVKIFATDVDKEAVEIAAKGVYSDQIVKDVSAETLDKFFIKEGNKYHINQHVRKMVIFAHHNVIKDPPYSKIDLISCRNMLIYMNPVLQKKILSTFHFSLNIGGYLFLGSSESPGDLAPVLADVNRKWKIYKNMQASKHIIFDSYATPAIQLKKPAVKAPDAKLNKSSLLNTMGDVFNEVVMEQFGYVGIFIDENYEVLQAMGDYKKYLQLPDKRLNFQLLRMVPEELSVALGVAIRKAVKNNTKVVTKRVRVKDKNRFRFVNLIVKPYLLGGEHLQKFIFIMLNEVKLKKPSVHDFDAEDKEVTNFELFNDLELELKETKENLHAAVEELETANEELQSSNEELLSSNEELQSTNEELQSLNEELHTVNTEHQLKIKELIELNDDFNNYFRSTEIGQIFIDKNLIIRKYTPAVMNQINIIETDIGRPISHFSYNIKYEYLVEDIRHVNETGETLEKEIEVRNGRYYLMRILPYIRLDKKTDGVVITFVDITTLKNLNYMITGVLNSSLNGIMAFKSVRNEENKIIDFRWVLANDASEKMVNRKRGALIGKMLLEEMPGNKEDGLFEKYVQVVETGKPLHQEHYYEHEGMKTWFEIVAVKMDDGFAVTFADISEKKYAEKKIISAYEDLKKAEENLKKLNNDLEKRVKERTRELSLSEERFRLVSLATNDAVWDWNMITNELWWNESIKSMFGYQPDEIESGIESWHNRLHPDDRERVIESINQVINSGEKQWADEYRFLRKDGTYAFIFGRGYVLHNEYDMPHRMLSSLVDLTKLKEAQEELKQTNENLVRINYDLDNFVYTASHDLKAPIINLEGLVKNLNKHLIKDNENINFIMDLIQVTIERFKKTINDLTEISKIQKDIQEDVSTVNLYEIMDDISVSIRDMIESAKAKIHIDFKEISEIEYSKKNLNSILYNFLSNAIKYRSPERELQIKLKTERVDGYVCLTVTDNGLGIENDKIGKLFTMFKRFHDHVDGSGVGLYIVKRIIENAEGLIEVESEEGKGTTFKVYFKVNKNE